MVCCYRNKEEPTRRMDIISDGTESPSNGKAPNTAKYLFNDSISTKHRKIPIPNGKAPNTAK